MHILIVYGTTEGHTRELCHFAARCLREAGHLATVEEAGPDEAHPDPGAYDAALLAASLHVGQFQAPLVRFARAQRATLEATPSAFLSVSLCAAGLDPDDWEGLDACFARFRDETQWSPASVHHAAGAIRYSQYDFFKRLALKHIAAKHGNPAIASRDHDMTDYDSLRDFLLEFARGAERAPKATASTRPAERSTPQP